MLDTSTLYLILAMTGFVFIAIITVHQHNSSEQIRRKRSEVEGFSTLITKKIEALENQIINLKIEIDDLDDEIGAYQMQAEK